MGNPSPVELFAILNADFQSIADCINTGTENPATSRALIVFNLTPHPLSGIAVFRASMSWPRDMLLPPVAITDSEGGPTASAIREMREGPDAKGRADQTLLSFAIYFAVTDVPANGWRTYIASYAAAFPRLLKEAAETPGLHVRETMRHGGDLPGSGTLELLLPQH